MRWSVEAFNLVASDSSGLSFPVGALVGLLLFQMLIEFSAELQYVVSCASPPFVLPSGIPLALALMLL